MDTTQKVKVEIRNASLSYGDTPILRDVSLSIEPGEFFALLGPSGSGKSTLLRLIAGFNQAQTGAVVIGGEDITRMPPWERNIGMVFQNYALWPHMTVYRNVAFGLEEHKLPRDVIRRKVMAALELVGLGDLGERRPGQLSGGQQQRVALARTIAIEPKVLLLDEPLSNLDAKLRVYMRTELLSLQRKLGITTIFVTHDQEEALSISDRVAVLDGGVIQQIGTPMELYDQPANRFIANFIGTINLLKGVVMSEGAGMTFDSPAVGRVALLHGASPGVAEIGIRPHALMVTVPEDEEDSSRLWINGTVANREFLGEFIRYTVQVAGTALIADVPHYGGHPVHPPGKQVKIGINPQHARLLTA
jgi:iron(III) transport system ATP-binding protein